MTMTNGRVVAELHPDGGGAKYPLISVGMTPYLDNDPWTLEPLPVQAQPPSERVLMLAPHEAVELAHQLLTLAYQAGEKIAE